MLLASSPKPIAAWMSSSAAIRTMKWERMREARSAC